MSWKRWTAVVLAIGVGILLQIPRHDEDMEAHHPPAAGEISADRSPTAVADASAPSVRTGSRTASAGRK